jgi:SUMO ligase MMS21 Smc5/6 complex component
VTDPSAWYENRIEELKAEYKRKPDPARFKGVELYENFRKLVWDINNDGKPLPAEDGEEEEEDEDLMVAAEIVSYNCPITKRPFEQPVMAPKCKHVFSKDAIMQMPVANGLVEVRLRILSRLISNC